MTAPQAVALPRDLAIIWARRHYLPTDVLRSLDSIWVCATAASAAPPDRFWERDPHWYDHHDTVTCSLRTYPLADPSPPPAPLALPLRAAVNELFGRRHRLSPAEMQAVQQAWCCGSAAHWGAPFEAFWDLELDQQLAEHTVTDCEAPTDWGAIPP